MRKKVYEYRELPALFTTSSIDHVLGINKRRLNRLLESWIDGGEVVRLRNGIYARSDSNQFGIAAKLYNGYIGLSSALYLHGLKTELERIVYVCVSTKQRPCNFKNVKFMPIPISKQLYGTELHDGILISTYPKTIFDMLLKPRYANTFDMFRALNIRPFNNSEWKEVLLYAKDANLSTVRRMGLVFDGRAPAWFIKSLLSLARPVGRSFFRSKKTESYNDKWHIYDNFNIRRWENAV